MFNSAFNGHGVIGLFDDFNDVDETKPLYEEYVPELRQIEWAVDSYDWIKERKPKLEEVQQRVTQILAEIEELRKMDDIQAVGIKRAAVQNYLWYLEDELGIVVADCNY